MKLSAIKTRQGFYDFADIWYQRTHNLRRIWQSEDTDMIRKFKAFDLWIEMVRRVQLLQSAAILINQHVPKEQSYQHPIIGAEYFNKQDLFNSMKNGSHSLIYNIMNPNKKARKLIYKHLDKIYRTCRGMTASWGDEVISMNVLKFVIDKSKFKNSTLPEEFVKNYNSMLDELVITCRKQAVGNTISFRYLRADIKVMKKSIAEGMR